MDSWRAQASAQVQADLDGLLNLVLSHAHELLRRDGGFFPYAATVTLDGEIALMTPETPGRKPRPGKELLESLYAEAQNRSRTIRAAAFVADVRAGANDGIGVQLEHHESIAIAILLPYRRNRLTKNVRLAPMTATPGTHRVWPPPAN